MAIRAYVNFKSIVASASHRKLDLNASLLPALGNQVYFTKMFGVANFRSIFLDDIRVNVERTIFFFTSDLSFSDIQQISATKNIIEPLGLLSADPEFNIGKGISNTLNLNDFLRTGVGKGISDSVTLSEGQVFSSIKAVSDSIAFSENVSTLLTYIRGFASFTTMVESVSFDSGKNVVNQINFSEETTTHPKLGKADSVSLTDIHATEVGKLNLEDIPFLDGVVIARQPFNFVFTEALDVVTVTGEPTDSFGFTSGAPIFSIDTILQDHFALDDFAQVNKDTVGVKVNVVGLSDQIEFDHTVTSSLLNNALIGNMVLNA